MVVLLNSCARYHFVEFMSGNFSPTAGLEKDELNANDKNEFNRVKNIGDKIIEYDKYSWESTDILLKEYDMDENKDSISGWVVLKNGNRADVCFGQWKDSLFIIKKTVVWNNDEYYLNDSVYVDSLATKMFKAQKISIQLNKDYIRTYHPNTNTYCFKNSDTLTVYLIPATNRDDYYVFGGGIRTIFIGNGTQIQSNDVLHPKSYIFKKEYDTKMNVRPTFSNNILDEVDYFQTKVTGQWLTAQYLINANFPRMISYVKTNHPDTEFIILKDDKRK